MREKERGDMHEGEYGKGIGCELSECEGEGRV